MITNWVVETMRPDRVEGFVFERLHCADFQDALDHALDTPTSWTKPRIRKAPAPAWYYEDEEIKQLQEKE